MRFIIAGASALFLSLVNFDVSYSDPAPHPAYLHALTDLHMAYAAVETRGGDDAMRPHEQAALDHIHAAATFIREASSLDDKDIHYAPPADTHPGRIGKLHDARAFLQKAESDVHEAEADQAARPFQLSALDQIAKAEHSVDVAMTDYQQNK